MRVLYRRAAGRFAGWFWITSFPGVRCAHPGLYAVVRFADCFLGLVLVAAPRLGSER